jgi:hypothetical protein
MIEVLSGVADEYGRWWVLQAKNQPPTITGKSNKGNIVQMIPLIKKLAGYSNESG